MKTLTIIAAMVILCLSVKAQTSQIKGVVTYYFNQYQGDKADIGAKIYVHKIDPSKIDSSFLNNYFSAKAMRAILEMTKKDKKYPNREKYLSRLMQLHADTKIGFDSLAQKTYISLLKLENEASTIKTVVDGSGNYSINIEPGAYEIIIISNGRKDCCIETEVAGKIHHEGFEIKANEVHSCDVKFDQF